MTRRPDLTLYVCSEKFLAFTDVRGITWKLLPARRVCRTHTTNNMRVHQYMCVYTSCVPTRLTRFNSNCRLIARKNFFDSNINRFPDVFPTQTYGCTSRKLEHNACTKTIKF